MLKRISQSIILLLLFSFQCEDEYLDNQRISIKGTLISTKGEFFENIFVAAYVDRGYTAYPNNEPVSIEDLRLLGNNESNNKGEFNIIIPAPGNNRDNILLINSKNLPQYNSQIASIRISGIELLNQDDETYCLPVQELESIIDFQLNLVRDQNNTDTLLTDIGYRSTTKNISFSEFAEVGKNDLNVLSQMTPNEMRIKKILNLLENDTIILRYELRNKDIIKKDSLKIPVGFQNSYDFVF